MADTGIIKTYLAGLDADLRKVFDRIFDYILADVRFGRCVSGYPSKNCGGGFFYGKTPASANTEFEIQHSFGHTPYLIIPVLPLDQVNATIVPLTVARAADATRVFLKSTSTNAPFFVYIEG